MHFFLPIIGTFVGFAMAALYVASIAGQAGPDHADPAHPSPSPWYLRKGCSLATAAGRGSQCQQAQALLAMAVLILYAMTLFPIRLAFPPTFRNGSRT